MSLRKVRLIYLLSKGRLYKKLLRAGILNCIEGKNDEKKICFGVNPVLYGFLADRVSRTTWRDFG